MGALFHGLEGFAGIIECIDPIHHRTRTVGRDRPIHGFEMSPRADVNTLDANLAVENQRDGQRLFRLAQYSDLRDRTTKAHGLQGLGESPSPADFDNQIGAAIAGLVLRPTLPIRETVDS